MALDSEFHKQQFTQKSWKSHEIVYTQNVSQLATALMVELFYLVQLLVLLLNRVGLDLAAAGPIEGLNQLVQLLQHNWLTLKHKCLP